MEFRVLGALQVHVRQRLPLAGQRQQRLLAGLLLVPNRVAPLSYLVDAVWDDDPPATAKRQLQNSISALRPLLDDGPAAPAILSDGPGYRLRVAPHQLDALLFADRIAEAQALVARHNPVEAADLMGKPLLAGRRAYAPAPLGVPHSWTSITDVARTLVTVAVDERAWGRAWHVPTNPPMTIRELAVRFSKVAGAPTPKLTAIPYPVMWTIGLFSPLARELRTTRYQFYRPFILDSTLTTQTFGIEPTPLDEVLRTAAASLTG